jgi:hypothetical protein
MGFEAHSACQALQWLPMILPAIDLLSSGDMSERKAMEIGANAIDEMFGSQAEAMLRRILSDPKVVRDISPGYGIVKLTGTGNRVTFLSPFMIDAWLKRSLGIGFHDFVRRETGASGYTQHGPGLQGAGATGRRALADVWRGAFQGLSIGDQENVRGLERQFGDFRAAIQVYFACEKNMARARETLATFRSV